MTYDEIVELIESMDASEADAMGVSCQYFAQQLIDKLDRAWPADEEGEVYEFRP